MPYPRSRPDSGVVHFDILSSLALDSEHPAFPDDEIRKGDFLDHVYTSFWLTVDDFLRMWPE
jgi:hypothetical protein